MNVYDHFLSQSFPHCLLISRFRAPRVAELLTSADQQHVNGSSFAVTADADRDTVKLWLSSASLNRLLADELFGDVIQRSTRGEPC
jgi:hypothetical protein